MAVSIKRIWQQAVEFGLLDKSSVRAWQQKYVAATGVGGDGDPVVLAKFLISQRVLTRFEAERLVAGRGHELRQGDYALVDRCKTSPLTRWYHGRHVADREDVFIYRFAKTRQASHPFDATACRAHAAVHADGLQPLKYIDADHPSSPDPRPSSQPWGGLIVSKLPDGKTLADRSAAANRRIGARSVVAIGRVIAGALDTLHRASIVHGGVSPNRIWVGDDRSIWLLRNAVGLGQRPAPNVLEDDWLDDDPLAPAYRDPTLDPLPSAPDASADLYALGRVLHDLLSGEVINAAGQRSGESSSGVPADVLQAHQLGASGDPLLRTIYHAICEDRRMRFADLASFATALSVAGEAIQRLPALTGTMASDGLMPSTQRPDATAKPIVPSEPVAERSAGPNLGDELAGRRDEPSRAQPSAPPLRRRARRRRRGPVLIGAAAVAILMGLLAILVRTAPQGPRRDLSGNTFTPRVAADRAAPSVDDPRTSPSSTAASGSFGTAPSTPAPSASPSLRTYDLVDDQRLLWEPPWGADSSAVSLDLLPPGPQMIVTIRWRDLLQRSPEVPWSSWFGSDLAAVSTLVQQRTGVPASEIDRLTIAATTNQSGKLLSTLTVDLSRATTILALRERFDLSAARTRDGKAIYSGEAAEADAFYFPGDTLDDATQVNRYTVGPLELIERVAEVDGESIVLSRSLQQLWDRSSDQAGVVVLLTPNFLFADGRQWIDRFATRIAEPMRTFLMPDVNAAMVSFDLSRQWYGELRLSPGSTVEPPAILHRLEQAFSAWPDWAESFLVDTDVPPSWRPLAIRLPRYFRALVEQMRLGISDRLPMANFYLPAEGAPQVVLATLLAIAPSTQAAAPMIPRQSSERMLSVEQMLDMNLSVRFDQESLEFAVETIRDEFARTLPAGNPPLTIRIVGADLEKQGITQNQQIRDFQMRDQPLRAAVTEIVRQANPDKSIASIRDAKQSLIWVVDPSSTPEAPTILITTRPAAAEKNYPIPPEFSTP